ncbi:Polygalacturonase [Glycine soja]
MKMVFPHSMVTIALVLMLASYVKAHVGLFDIRKYGAIPNGDTTMDLQNAWRDACVSMTPSKVVVPSGKYKLRQIDFMGLIKLILRIRFGYINFLTLFGNGTFHGQGKMAWKQNNCAKNKNCKKLAMNFGFEMANNLNITFTNFRVSSPAYNPNTDGTHIRKLTQVKITNSKLAPTMIAYL